MDTPRRFKDPDSDSLATTPFRERALQEQKLKEELLLSGTPGWRKKSPERNVDTVSKNPSEVKKYLRDLSSVLASQGRNLTSYLAEQASTQEEQTDSEIKLSPQALSPLKSHRSIAESVFSQLESTVQRPKIRKIDNVVIRDVERPLVQEDQLSWLETSPIPSIRGPSNVEAGLPVQELGYEEGAIEQDGLEPSQQVSPKIESPQSLESDRSSVGSEPEMIEPLNITRLKHFFNQFMDQNGIKLGSGSWRSLQDASMKLTETLAKDFLEDNRIVMDRQNILKTLGRFEIVPQGATNDDLFELCCKYLPLEELNELEMALFL